MAILKLLQLLLPMIKDSKTLLGTVILSAVLGQYLVGYVDAKHKEGMQKITETQHQVQELHERDYQTQVMLKSIDSNVEDIADKLKVMDQRLWELYRDSKQSKIEAQNQVYSNVE